jgi:hypothetical protein
MSPSMAVRLCLLAAGASLAAGCASSCSASPEKLSALRRGMTYAETAQIMGCEGTQVSRASVASGELATVEWGGPTRPLSTHTLMDFQDGRLLSFSTGQRFGL